VYGFFAAQFGMNFPGEVYQFWVDLYFDIASPIAQKPVDLLLSQWNEFAMALKGYSQSFFSVDVVECDSSGGFVVGQGITALCASVNNRGG